jgi:hypothetical protein
MVSMTEVEMLQHLHTTLPHLLRHPAVVVQVIVAAVAQVAVVAAVRAVAVVAQAAAVVIDSR